MSRPSATRRVSPWRRRLYLLGLVPLALAVLFAGKVVAMSWFEASARSAYDEGRLDDALSAYRANGRANLLEPWVATFGEGTTRLRAEDFVRAVTDLESALRDAPAAESCRVRVNLALAHEGAGSEPGLAREERRAAWREGRQVLADGDCLEEPATDEDATAVDRRLRQLLKRQPDAEPDPEPTQEPEQPQPTQEPEQPEETESGPYAW